MDSRENILLWKNSKLRIFIFIKDMQSLEKWLEQAKYVTIADIEKLEYGTKKQFLCLEKNYYRKITYAKLEDIFKGNIILQYSHLADLAGTVKWTDDTSPKEFEFHIECVPDFWFPLCKGTLPDFNVPPFLNLPNFQTDWKNYPKNTRIGWRGPIIDWDDVQNSPEPMNIAVRHYQRGR